MIHKNLYKSLTFFALLFNSLWSYAQKPCEFDFEVQNDSIQYRETKKQLIYERELGKRNDYAFISLINDQGYVMLNYQRIQKSDSFIETQCFDQDTRMYLQLTNGKTYTLIHSDKDICSSRLPDLENKTNIRLLDTSFFFTQDDNEDLKKFPVFLMQIKFGAGEEISYVLEKELISKNLGISSNPDSIFINYYKCIE